MRRTFVLFSFLASIALAPMTARSQGIDPAQENFVNAFLAVRKAEEQAASGDERTALKTYRAAAATLQKIKQQYPNWQPELLDYRLQRTLTAISALEAKVGAGAPAEQPLGNPPVLGDDPAVLPPVDLNNTPAPRPNPVGKGQKPPRPLPVPSVDGGDDPIAGVKHRIDSLQQQLDEANRRLAEEQKKNEQISGELEAAVKARQTAEAERKKAADVSEVVQNSLSELRKKGEDASSKARELQSQLTALQTKSATSEADLAAAEERINQLLSRSKAVAQRASEAGTLPAEIKKLQDKLAAEEASKQDLTTKLDEANKKVNETKGLPGKLKELEQKLAEEQAAKKELNDRLTVVMKERDENKALPAKLKELEEKLVAEQTAKKKLDEKLVVTSKERDDARQELTRLKEANKQVDKLMADNASLMKKLGDAEKLIADYKTEGPKKDSEITALKKQVTETQKALTESQGKNTSLQGEVGDLRKKMEDYNKQIEQAKTDKISTAEDRRKMEEENKLLQGIVMRVLQEDANRSQRKKMVQKELDRLQVQSDVLLKQVSYLTEPVVKLNSSERRLFKRPIIDVQDPNTIVAIKTDAGPEPTETSSQGGALLEASAGLKQDPKTAVDLPAHDPEGPITAPPAPAPQGINGTANGLTGLPDDVRPLAEQAKQAFEKDKYADAEKFYEKALQLAPNNLYLWSNKGVTQFRSGKFKNAEESFRKALAIAPEDHFSWCTLGIVEYSQGKYDEAVNSLTKSLAINSKNATAHNYLGITAAQKGWLEAAQKELETALQLDAKYADAWFNLAVTQTLKNPPNKEEAKRAYNKALEFGAEPDTAMEGLFK